MAKIKSWPTIPLHHYPWWPQQDRYEGGKQDSILKYARRTTAGKDELGSQIESMLCVGLNYAWLLHLTYFCFVFSSSSIFWHCYQ